MRTNDLVSGMVIIALAALMFVLTLSFPPFPGQKYGPSLFPRLLAVGLVLCGVLLIMRHVRGQDGRTFEAAPWMSEWWRVVSFLLIILVPAACIVLLDRVGFVPLAFVSLLSTFWWFRTRPATAVAAALLGTVLLQIFFGKLMRVPLPPGLLLNLPPHWLQYFM